MGQYYMPIMQKENSKKVVVYNRRINGEYTMAKLMEHSYIHNYLMETICKLLYKNKRRLAWVGDYSEEEELQKLNIPLSVKKIWGNETKGIGLKRKVFDYKDKYLINHTTKEYISFNDYIENYINATNEEEYITHPLSILTSIGNGKGGGDFSGPNDYLAGTWAWNLIETSDIKPKGYEKFEDLFIEE